jgi:hypothetical protein
LSLVSAAKPARRIDLSDQSVFVLDGTAPAQIGTGETPNVVGSPATSLFQTDEIGLCLRHEIAWTTGRRRCVGSGGCVVMIAVHHYLERDEGDDDVRRFEQLLAQEPRLGACRFRAIGVPL